MCGRFTLRTPLNVLMKQFGFESTLQLALRYNIAPTQDVLTVRVYRMVAPDSTTRRRAFSCAFHFAPPLRHQPLLDQRTIR